MSFFLFSLSTCWCGVRGRAGDETVTQPLSQRANRHDRRKLHLPGVVKKLHSLNGKETAPCLGAGVKWYLSLSLTWMSIYKGWSNPHLCVTVIIYSTVTFLLMSLEIYLILLPPLSMAKDLARRERGSPEFKLCVNKQIFQQIPENGSWGPWHNKQTHKKLIFLFVLHLILITDKIFQAGGLHVLYAICLENTFSRSRGGREKE